MKVFEVDPLGLPKTKVPFPILVMLEVPETTPETVNPWTTFEAVALTTLKVCEVARTRLAVVSRP